MRVQSLLPRSTVRTVFSTAAALLAAASLGLVAATLSTTIAAAPAQASTVAGPISRTEVLARAQWWIDTYGVIYSQDQADAKPDGDGHTYRPDCSGFVSMAWHLPKLANGWDRSTDSLAPEQFADTAYLNSYDDLLPGDAVLGVAYGHVVLFAGWVDAAHTTMRFYEEYDFGQEGRLTTRDRSWFAANGFRAIRYKKVGTWQLSLVKTRSISGNIEVHEAADPYQSFGLHAATGLSAGEANLGQFQLLSDQLMYVKTSATGSGRVELHSRSAASGFQSPGVDLATWFSVGDGSNGLFSIVNGDLVFIKTRNTGSGMVEVHRVSGANLTGPPVYSVATLIPTADAANGTFQMVGNDLVFIKTHNTGSGRVEVHIADPATNYTTWKLHAATVFSSGDWTNGVFSMHNVYSGGDGDLVFIKTRSTGTGTVELFVASGGGGYGSLNLATPTAYSVGDGGNGWWDLVNA